MSFMKSLLHEKTARDYSGLTPIPAFREKIIMTDKKPAKLITVPDNKIDFEVQPGVECGGCFEP